MEKTIKYETANGHIRHFTADYICTDTVLYTTKVFRDIKGNHWYWMDESIYHGCMESNVIRKGNRLMGLNASAVEKI